MINLQWRNNYEKIFTRPRFSDREIQRKRERERLPILWTLTLSGKVCSLCLAANYEKHPRVQMCSALEPERNIREPRDVNRFHLVPETSGDSSAHLFHRSWKELSLLKIKETSSPPPPPPLPSELKRSPLQNARERENSPWLWGKLFALSSNSAGRAE